MEKFSSKLPPEITTEKGEQAFLRIKKTNCPTSKGNQIEHRWTVRYLRKVARGEILPDGWSYKEVIVNRNIDLEKACEGLYKKLLKRGLINDK